MLPNAQVQLQASQIEGAGVARANPSIACQLQRSLYGRTPTPTCPTGADKPTAFDMLEIMSAVERLLACPAPCATVWQILSPYLIERTGDAEGGQSLAIERFHTFATAGRLGRQPSVSLGSGCASVGSQAHSLLALALSFGRLKLLVCLYSCTHQGWVLQLRKPRPDKVGKKDPPLPGLNAEQAHLPGKRWLPTRIKDECIAVGCEATNPDSLCESVHCAL